jgi:hypothetical protein
VPAAQDNTLYCDALPLQLLGPVLHAAIADILLMYEAAVAVSVPDMAAAIVTSTRIAGAAATTTQRKKNDDDENNNQCIFHLGSLAFNST